MAKRNGRSPSPTKQPSRQWRRMDLHIHSPASNDYQEPGAAYLDILHQAEIRGLDILAITDHNTVAGFAALKKELEQLLWLEEIKRIETEEQRRLDEYRRLLSKILLLPGFEFTATFGFHILGIFPPETPVSFLEHLLLDLKVPPDTLHVGSSTVGSTSDVLMAYRIINEAGGIVIAAHANSGNGVMLRGLDFGGQTRIAYTQDPNLHVLEVTDLEKRGRYTTRRFFDGSKPEYPRPMRCIQGSDAHRLLRSTENPKNLGVGDRVTEVLLNEVSFEALAAVLKGNDFSLTRPYRGPAKPVDFLQVAREEGESIVQAFHESMTQRGGYLDRILQDICAMANSNGGTVYIGLDSDPKKEPVGVREHNKAIERLQQLVTNRLSPEPEMHADSLPAQDKRIVRVIVQPGTEPPYAIDQYRFYIRDDSGTNLAVRDEIVQLVKKGLSSTPAGESGTAVALPIPTAIPMPLPTPEPTGSAAPQPESEEETPRTGVEIVNSEKREGAIYHTVRDLRNGNLIKNVTKSSARKLWRYAITQTESGAVKPDKLRWQGNKALVDRRQKGDNVWYDLAMRDASKTVHIYYGVTDSGLSEAWLPIVGSE